MAHSIRWHTFGLGRFGRELVLAGVRGDAAPGANRQNAGPLRLRSQRAEKECSRIDSKPGARPACCRAVRTGIRPRPPDPIFREPAMTFAAALASLEVLKNPYPGVRPFQPEQAHLFFGRDVQI